MRRLAERERGRGGAPNCADHLEETVALCVECMFQLKHVLVLLRIDVFIRKVHRQSLKLKLHSGCLGIPKI